MRIALFGCLIVSGCLLGCGESSSDSSGGSAQTNNAGGSNEAGVITAPVDYLGALAQAKQHSVKVVDLATVNQAIQTFQVEHGRFPNDLNELVTEKYLPRIPDAPYGMKITYDATTGKAAVVKAN